MKINIDQQKCIGCGSCLAVCPDFFELRDDNKAYLKEDKHGDIEDADCVQEAVEICPVQAIEVEP